MTLSAPIPQSVKYLAQEIALSHLELAAAYVPANILLNRRVPHLNAYDGPWFVYVDHAYRITFIRRTSKPIEATA